MPPLNILIFRITGAKVITSMLDSSKDDRSPQNLVILHVRERCRQLNLLKNTFDYSYFTNTPPLVHSGSIPSALCRLNDTFSFVAVDSLLYSHFATALGVNLKEYKDQTTAVIFDNRVSGDESVHLNVIVIE